jgi:hypothetical protein
VTGARIFILADILTGDKQEYNGATLIGDGTYLGRDFVKGFLFDSHYQYFEYTHAGAISSIDYLNNDPRYVRILVSKDPSVTFNGTVDDVKDYTHTLLVAAIAANVSSARAPSTMPVINFNNSVSQTVPLYSLNVQTVATVGANNPDLSAYVGQINLAGNVTTYSNQVFHSASMTASSGSADGNVVFSVFDPKASISFILPIENGQTALVNLSSSVVVNGNTNLIGNYKQNKALGYVPSHTREMINYAQLAQRTASLDLMDFIDEADKLIATVEVRMPQVDWRDISCPTLTLDECWANKI